jgi:light-regulated signal transduction histidine kinase (bacteriophytochrome)
VVGRVLERLTPDIEAAHAEIVTPEVWPAVWGYAPWIEEVWANYISNALKYGGDEESGVAPRVELGVRDAEEGTGYRFFVRDKGSRTFASLHSYSYASAWRTLTLVARSAGHRLASADSSVTAASQSAIPPAE